MGKISVAKCRTAFWAMFQSSFQSSFLSNVPLLNDSTVIIFFMVRLLLRLWLSNFRICSILQHLGQKKKQPISKTKTSAPAKDIDIDFASYYRDRTCFSKSCWPKWPSEKAHGKYCSNRQVGNCCCLSLPNFSIKKYQCPSISNFSFMAAIWPAGQSKL